MANLECNAVCGVAITHHFLAKMVCTAPPPVISAIAISQRWLFKSLVWE